MTIQRHTVIAAAACNGWERLFACPNYDVFVRTDTEVYVYYYETGRIQAANIGDVDALERVPTVPRNGSRLNQVLGWIEHKPEV